MFSVRLGFQLVKVKVAVMFSVRLGFQLVKVKVAVVFCASGISTGKGKGSRCFLCVWNFNW
jgi:hypothetical protein